MVVGSVLTAAREVPNLVISTTVHGNVSVSPDAIGAQCLRTALAPGVVIHSIRPIRATVLMGVIGQNRPSSRIAGIAPAGSAPSLLSSFLLGCVLVTHP